MGRLSGIQHVVCGERLRSYRATARPTGPPQSRGKFIMKNTIWAGPFVALAIVTAAAGCASSTRTTESTGQYVDDATITTKVKSAVLAEPGLHELQISVETYKDVVQLSGFVDTNEAKDKAGMVAAKVDGVRSVRNNLVVK
jgi:hyperosmotically inducible protein